MNFADGMQAALDYIEAHLTEKLDYGDIAQKAACSKYHFQRVFGLLCGFTLGEYIRGRRLTAAGRELALRDQKVIDVALKYGYDSPDSFARAFTRFHGITPSEARKPGAVLRSFARLSVKISLEGANMLNYQIEERPEMILTGYKRRFTGVPYGPDRERQEEEFFISTRAGQWLLQGARDKTHDDLDLCVITNVGDDGYDFYYAVELDEWTRGALRKPAFTGIDAAHMEAVFGLEDITIPKTTYAVFRTAPSFSPIPEYFDIRQRLASEWGFLSEWQFADAPELAIYHWYPGQNRDKRYIEVWIPIVKE